MSAGSRGRRRLAGRSALPDSRVIREHWAIPVLAAARFSGTMAVMVSTIPKAVDPPEGAIRSLLEDVRSACRRATVG